MKSQQSAATRSSQSEIRSDVRSRLLRTTDYGQQTHGFTLIETLVAISILTIAIVAPMGLTAQSLAVASYARDQITAFYLAQEGIEAVRDIRDGQILKIAQGSANGGVNLFGTIPIEQPGTPPPQAHPFTIDTLQTDPATAIAECATGTCPPLRADSSGAFYGYDGGWTPTRFTRTVHAQFVKNPDGSTNQDEIRVASTVEWVSGKISRQFVLYENLYRWVSDGAAN